MKLIKIILSPFMAMWEMFLFILICIGAFLLKLIQWNQLFFKRCVYPDTGTQTAFIIQKAIELILIVCFIPFSPVFFYSRKHFSVEN